MRNHLHATALLLLICCISPLQAQENSHTENLSLPSGDTISAEVFASPQKPTLRILWIAPDFGLDSRSRQLAEALAKAGMEVWQVDVAEALFLPRSATTMREIPGSFVADIISALSDDNRKQVLIISNSYGAIPTLRGIHAWQERHPTQASLLGAVLFSPALFSRVPQLGVAPDFIAEVHATNAPLYIFQAAKSGNRWHLPELLAPLQQHAPVYVEMMPGVTSLFYNEDTAPETLAALNTMPEKILRAVRQLQNQHIPLKPLTVPPTTVSKGSGLDTKLRPYHGSVEPRGFTLADINGDKFSVDNFKGRLTIINFWASWCHPCVEEIPSLNRLKQAMQDKPFQLISINYAETPEQIREFMKMVAVDYPVLMDTDGSLTAQWKVVAYPSTFVIGPDGKIQYGVNAAIHWDSSEVMELLNQMLSTTKSAQ